MIRLDLSGYKKFNLPYWISNGGDGSANLRLAKTLKEAEKEDESQSEGWGESSASEITIYEKDGRLFFKEFNFKTKPYNEYLVEVT